MASFSVTLDLHIEDNYTSEELAALANAVKADIELFKVEIPFSAFSLFLKQYATDTTPKTYADYQNRNKPCHQN